MPRRVHRRHRHPDLLLRPAQPLAGGSNEDTNELLRQYMPKGIDLSVHTAEDLAWFEYSLNNRPRKTPGYMNHPSESPSFFAEALNPPTVTGRWS